MYRTSIRLGNGRAILATAVRNQAFLPFVPVEETNENYPDEAIEMVMEGNRLLAEDVAREKISSEESPFAPSIQLVRP